MDECTVLKRLKAGDEQALGWLIDRYTVYVSTIVHSVIGTAMGRSDVEEVTADVFFALWQNRSKVQPGKLRPYLSALARNTALNKLRQRRQELPLEEDVLTVAVSAPEQSYTKKELAALIRRAVAALPWPEREIFLRHYYYCQRVKDIAAALGMNESTVKTKLHRGREVLRRSIQEGGYIDGI